MKKVIPAILLLAVVAAAAIFFFQRKGKNFDLPPGFAAELAPADALFFLEVPDVARTLDRWKQNGIYLVSQEPEWKEFTANWDKFAAENEYAKDFFGVLEPIRKADPAGLFFAMAKPAGPIAFGSSIPKVIGGFPYRGKKSDVEGVIRKLKEQLMKTWPGAKSELSKYEEIEIETITSATPLGIFPVMPSVPRPGDADGSAFPKVHLAYRDNWFFFATDKALLTGTLDRYLHKAGAGASLAKDAVFQATLKHGNADPDLTMWARATIMDQFTGVFGLITGVPGVVGASPTPDANPIQAFLYSWKLDGPIMRDRFYIHMTHPPKLTPTVDRSVALTDPNTYVYANINYDNLVERGKALIAQEFAPAATLATSAMEELTKELKARDLTVNDIFTTFGPEIVLTSAWVPGPLTLPDFFAAVEIRDPVKGRKFAEWMGAQLAEGPNKPPAITTEGGVTRWVSPEGFGGVFRPAMALTDHHLMFGITPAAIDKAIKQLATKAPNLNTKPESPYQAAVKKVNPPDGGLLYVDAKALFECLYAKGKAPLAFELVGSPSIGKYFDAGKLPHDTTISKHLAPIVISYGADSEGWLIEGTGTVSFVGMYAVTLPAGLFWGVAAPSMSPTPAFSTTTTVNGDIQAIGAMLLTYETTNGAAPTTAQGLSALVTQPTTEPKPAKWKKLMSEVPIDPWGKPYQYRVPAKRGKGTFELFSNGPDLLPDTADDIGNWKE
jgi:general secretion pathway protein G